jgi:hypothetical protein
VVTDTKFYDDERSEESQKHSKKESDIEKTHTFTWENWDLKHDTPTTTVTWATLKDISATVFKRPNGTCLVNFSLLITGFSHRTDNDPFREDNPPLTLRVKNIDGAILFFVKIETEPYDSHIYHGLTVRCNYHDEVKDSSYEVGVVPFDEMDRAQLTKPGGRPVFHCSSG